MSTQSGGTAGSKHVETKDLIAAVTWGELDFLETCLQNGADPNQRDEKGDTPLHVACYYGELECTSVLLSYKGMGAGWAGPMIAAVVLCVRDDCEPCGDSKGVRSRGCLRGATAEGGPLLFSLRSQQRVNAPSLSSNQLLCAAAGAPLYIPV